MLLVNAIKDGAILSKFCEEIQNACQLVITASERSAGQQYHDYYLPTILFSKS